MAKSVASDKERRSSINTAGSPRHSFRKIDFSDQEMTKSGNIVFETVGYRWVILFVFCGLILNTAVITVGFSSYVAQIGKAYGVKKYAVITLMVLPTILYTPMNFLAAWCFSKWQINYVLRSAALV